MTLPTSDRGRRFRGQIGIGLRKALRRTVANLLGLEIDYYVLVDMAGFVDVVDALGGIDTLTIGWLRKSLPLV